MIAWKQTDVRTDGQTDRRTEAIALPAALMRSVNMYSYLYCLVTNCKDNKRDASVEYTATSQPRVSFTDDTVLFRHLTSDTWLLSTARAICFSAVRLQWPSCHCMFTYTGEEKVSYSAGARHRDSWIINSSKRNVSEEPRRSGVATDILLVCNAVRSVYLG